MARRLAVAGFFVSAMFIALMSFATMGRTDEASDDWKGIPVRTFLEIDGQQVSYVVGFMDSAAFAYHEFGVTEFEWLAKCQADLPDTTHPAEIAIAVFGKINAVLKDHPEIREEPVGLFIWAELEVRCGLAK